jgi:Protein of unknown function (DUF3616)
MRPALYACLAMLFAPPASADMQKVAPEGPFWDTSPGFAFPGAEKPKGLRRALSGIACPSVSSGPRRCIAVFDEGGEARYAIIDGRRVTPQPEPIVLLADGDLDAEGAATDGGFAYVTGSHSRMRGRCIANLGRRHVYRLPLQPDGRVQPSAQPADDQGRLWRLLSTNAELGPFVDKCLGKDGHGINIEGIAARNGQLYFGFREPARDKKAYILRVAARPLFEGGDLAPRLFAAEVGRASGIRDLLAVPEGILVLVGPDDDSKKDVPWWIGFWDGSDANAAITLRHLAELKLPAISGNDCQKEIKPEAMTLLADGPDYRRLLILSDGMCDGGPLAFRIPK